MRLKPTLENVAYTQSSIYLVLFLLFNFPLHKLPQENFILFLLE